jgi:hypothetical protein
MYLMEKKIYEAKVFTGLKELNQEALGRFSVLCAIRALPFAGEEGHFNYWKEENRQKHLYALLYSIDCGMSARIGIADEASYSAAYEAALEATIDAVAVDSVTLSAANAAIAAAYASFVSSCANLQSAEVFKSRITPRDAGRAFAVIGFRFSDALMDDIRCLNAGKPLLHTDTETYGPVWERFMTALRNEGCAYWAELYERLFANNLEPDYDELKLRMALAPEIRGEGARAVAEAMEKIQAEKGGDE